MWVKMNSDDIVAARQKEKKQDVIQILGLAVILTILTAAICDPKGYHPHVATLVEFAARFMILFIPIVIVCAIIVRFTKRGKRRTVICAKCESTKYDDGVLTCSCGGQFESLARMKWVENDSKAAARP